MNIPHSPESEKVVLASLAAYGHEALEACGRLREDMFALDANRVIFGVIVKLLEDGVEPDELAIRERLKVAGKLDSIGGFSVVLDVCDSMNANKSPGYHAQTVVEKWKLRTGIRICERYMSQFAEESPSDGTLSLMQAEVFDAMQELTKQTDPRIAAMTVPALETTLDYTTPAMGLSYGHGKLNDFTMGMQPGEVTVVGARSGVGKSSLALQAIYCNARKGIAGSFFSLEMNETTVQQRLWAMESGLPFNSIRRKLLNLSEQRSLREAAYRVAEMPIRIYGDGDMTLSQISAMARLDARRNGMQMFAVDYAQIVNADGKDERTRVAAVSRTLTKLAKAEGIHLMLLSQLTKIPREQYNRPPHIGDLAETRQLENDCHVCILAHRGYDEGRSQIAFDSELIIPKQRNGGTGAIQAMFNHHSLMFV
jgi:replicative DNA helicase